MSKAIQTIFKYVKHCPSLDFQLQLQNVHITGRNLVSFGDKTTSPKKLISFSGHFSGLQKSIKAALCTLLHESYSFTYVHYTCFDDGHKTYFLALRMSARGLLPE